MIEIAISAVALVIILLAGKSGLSAGFFVQLTTAVLALFGMLVALRFWYPAAGWLGTILGADEAQVAFGAFWLLFLLTFAPPYALLRSLNDRFIPVYPLVIERAFGFLAGCATGAVVASCLVTSLLLYLPKVLPGFEPTRLLLPLDRAPVAIYREIQQLATNVGWSKDEKIPFPSLTTTDSGKIEAKWK